MVAEPSTADYGRLTVMLQYRFDMEQILLVPPGAFYPPPKVDSAVVRMIPDAGRCGVADNEVLLEEVVSQAFAQRRKTLRNNLKGLVSDEELASIGIDAGWRAENVSVAQYVALANLIARRG